MANQPDTTACPVAAMCDEAARIITALDRLEDVTDGEAENVGGCNIADVDDVLSPTDGGPSYRYMKRILRDELTAAQSHAMALQARSLKGAAYQLLLAHLAQAPEADMDDWTGDQRAIDSALASAFRAMQANGAGVPENVVRWNAYLDVFGAIEALQAAA